MRKNVIFALVLVLVSACLLSCSSSGASGNNGGEEEETTPTNPVPPVNPGTPTKAVTGYELELTTGTYWTFWWDWSDKSSWMSSYDSGSDTDVGTGYITITLGDATTVGGKPIYKTIISGDIPEPWQTNAFWGYIGSDSSGVYASSDGYNLKYIVEASTGRVSNGFFRRWTDLTDAGAPVLADGTYSATVPKAWSTSVQTAEWGTSYDKTISVPGYNPIAGDEYTRSAAERFKPGIGPVAGSDYDYFYDRVNSSDSYTYITKWAFSLVKTNLAADDGFVPPKPTWDFAAMPDTREDPSAVILNGSLYVLLGGVLYDGNRTMYRQESNGSWTKLADFPSDFSGLYGYGTACSYNGKIYVFIKAEPSYKTAVYSYDPAGNSWTLLYSPGTLNVAPATCVVNGDTIFFLGHDSSRHVFDPAINTIASYSIINSKITYPRMISDGSNFYFVCQYNAYGDYYTTGLWECRDAGWTQLTWTMDAKRRCKPALAVADGRLWVFGGADKAVVSAALSAGGASGWRSEDNMLYGGSLLSAVVTGDEIRVLGSNSGKAIEIYNLNN